MACNIRYQKKKKSKKRLQYHLRQVQILNNAGWQGVCYVTATSDSFFLFKSCHRFTEEQWIILLQSLRDRERSQQQYLAQSDWFLASFSFSAWGIWQPLFKDADWIVDTYVIQRLKISARTHRKEWVDPKPPNYLFFPPFKWCEGKNLGKVPKPRECKVHNSTSDYTSLTNIYNI